MAPAIGYALGLGVLTTFYPCTMATSIAALTCLVADASNARRVLVPALFYAVGRAFTYTCLGVILSGTAYSRIQVADTLQHYAFHLLGPLLILAGMFACGLLAPNTGRAAARLLERLRRHRPRGAAGAFLLGAVLALAFCPASAAIFFGSVVVNVSGTPEASVLFAAAYGIGTALPVLIVAAVSAGTLAALQPRLLAAAWFTHILPNATGAMLIVAGLALTVQRILLRPGSLVP